MPSPKYMLIAVIIMLSLIGGGIFASRSWYQHKRLNENPAILARQAVEAHDLETFKRYVDLDKLIDSAAEEILTEQINSTLAPTAYSMDELQSRYDKLKLDFVDTARAAAEEYISTGKVTFPNNLSDAQNLLKKSDVASCEIKSITKPQKDGNTKIVTMMIHNPTMKFNFEIELILEPGGEVEWRITDAKGFGDYYKGYRRMLRRKLDSLNAPIAREMDSTFKVKSFSVKNEGGDEYGFSQTLNIEIKASVLSDKPIAQIHGDIVLNGKDENESRTPFTVDITNRAQGLQTFNVTKTLNPFVRADADAMKHGFRKNDIHIEVTEIIFADGTNLKQLDSLPE
ncbi:MAG: hypothetical protein IJK81_02685 [Selenomonadaceae bacterium]|nr:hypothetical protein [Selenomonadaceae bacterium]